MRYELTDREWTAIKPMLPNQPRGVPRVNGQRLRHVVECVNALKQLFAEGSRAPWTVHQWPCSESWLERPFVSRGPRRKQFA